MKIVIYRGYTIKSFPQQGTRADQWRINLEILWRHDGVSRTQSFAADSLYGSEEEADLSSVSYAQRIVDGNVSGLSATNVC